jgi:crotonobetainyl-CoA:carnitine CoA-transferase CaiB-like acyl-CoA transferase
MIAAGNDTQYQKMCEAMGLLELAQDEKLQTNKGRVKHREEVIGTLKVF